MTRKQPQQSELDPRSKRLHGEGESYDDINPQHYKGATFHGHDIQVIDIIDLWNLGFNLGNVLKYTLRAGKKLNAETITELEKARWYLDREIHTITATLKETKRDV